MSHPLKHPKAGELLTRVAQSFKADDTYILHDSSIIFVCGGPMDSSSMRPRFCIYAKTELPHLRVFLAESAQKDYVLHPGSEFQDVAEFEEIIGEVSTCIILFPESFGSFAELGYFAKNENLRKKLLVVNDAKLQGQDSFISLGPIKLIDRHSNFQPTIQLTYSDKPKFKLVKERLDKRISVRNRKRFNVKRYKDLSIQHKFYSIYEIIRLFQALTYEGVEYAFRRIWGNAKRTELHRLLSILVAADYVRRRGEGNNYFCVNRAIRSFLEFESLDVKFVTMKVIDLYEKNFAEIAHIVRDLEK